MTPLPTHELMLAFLNKVLPGHSAPTRRLREAIVDFASSPTARRLTLRGPIGSGKTTLARLVALLKRVAPLDAIVAQRILDDCRFDAGAPGQVDIRSILTWYVELSLTGLVDTLADVQLFGSIKSAYSGASDRPGVFEQAQTGRSPKAPAGARLTGGVVFLDEIGDLSPTLQAKLLPVLSGGTFYRVGNEGKDELQYHGVTICASWKNLAEVLRPDLFSRFSEYVIEVPSLADRTDDFDVILDELEASVLRTLRASIENALTVEPLLAKEYWRGRLDATPPLSQAARKAFRAVPWGRHGNLRGLAAALERVHGGGREPSDVLAQLPLIEDRSGAPTDASDLVKRLLQRQPDDSGLVEHVRALQNDDRQSLRSRLMSDEGLRRQLGTVLGIPEAKVSPQVRDLGRRRVRNAGEDS